MKLAICAIFKNEANYLREWIEFHEKQGFSAFYLFNDQSTDDSISVLQPFISRGLVFLAPAYQDENFKVRQLSSYDLGIQRAQEHECDWLAIIDVDEFLFSPNGEIGQHLPQNRMIGAVFVWWQVFGSAGRENPPSREVTETFTRSATFPGSLAEARRTVLFEDKGFWGNRKRPISGRLVQGKSLMRPQAIRELGNAHRPQKIRGFLVNENGVPLFTKNKNYLFSLGGALTNLFFRVFGFDDFRVPVAQKLRINHYWSRSKSELREKAEKWAGYKADASYNDYLRWDEVLNEMEDRVILQPTSSKDDGIPGNCLR